MFSTATSTTALQILYTDKTIDDNYHTVLLTNRSAGPCVGSGFDILVVIQTQMLWVVLLHRSPVVRPEPARKYLVHLLLMCPPGFETNIVPLARGRQLSNRAGNNLNF